MTRATNRKPVETGVIVDIERRRVALKISQAKLCAEAGVDKQHYSRVKLGIYGKRLSFDWVASLISALDRIEKERALGGQQ